MFVSCVVQLHTKGIATMKNTEKVIGADVWVKEIVSVVGAHVAEWNGAQLVLTNVTKHVRSLVAAKLELLKAGRIQPLDKETYRAAVLTMVTMLIGKDADRRAVATARQQVTSGSRWNFGVFSPSTKRRAQVARAKAAKLKRTKTKDAVTHDAATQAIAKAITAALRRGVTHAQILDAVNGLPTLQK